MKTSEKSILGEELTRKVNQGLRESLKVDQRIVDLMTTEEHVATVRDSLALTVENMNNLRRNHAAIDHDVLVAFRALVRDIRNFNDANREEIIPITQEIDDILAGMPFHTQTTHHAVQHDLGAPLLGSSDYHSPHYQTMNHNNNDTHVVGAAAHQDSDCCCSCILM